MSHFVRLAVLVLFFACGSAWAQNTWDGNGNLNVNTAGRGGTAGSGTTSPAAATPNGATASAIVTGGAATTLVTGPVKGCFIVNPVTAADENIAAAETVYLNPVTTATANGRGTNSAIVPGQSFSCVPGQTTNVSGIAATNGHALNVVAW